MNDLIPTPRMDKNGHVVVRHMKNEMPAGGYIKKDIPVPVIPSRDDVAELVSNAIAAMELEVGLSTTVERQNVQDHLPSLSREELETIIEWSGNENASRLWILHEQLQHDDGITFAKDFLHLSDFLEDHGIEEIISADYVRGFQQYKNLCPIADDGSYPEVRTEQCKTITKVLSTMVDMVDSGELREEYVCADTESWTPLIRDEQLQDLLLNKETDTEAVLKVIIERRVLDPAHIQAILKQEGGALSNGVI